MKFLLTLLFISSSLAAQQVNWACQMYQTSASTNDPYIVTGGPTNWPSSWKNIGAATNINSPFVFVGLDNITEPFTGARSNFIFSRYPAWSNWNFTVNLPLQTSNNTYQTTQKALQFQEDRQRQIRVGTTNLIVSDTTKVIQFEFPMNNSNYVIFFNPNGLNTVIGFTNRTLTGFTATISSGVTGAFAWMAVER